MDAGKLHTCLQVIGFKVITRGSDMRTDADYNAKECEQFVGKKVTSVVVDEDHEFMGLQFDNGKIAWVQCDPEGNGPGFLAIEKSK